MFAVRTLLGRGALRHAPSPLLVRGSLLSMPKTSFLSTTATALRRRLTTPSTACAAASSTSTARRFHTFNTPLYDIGIIPEPLASKPKNTDSDSNSSSDPDHHKHIGHHVAEPATISMEQYHDLANEYLDTLLTRLEDICDQREDVDVEYSAGVLTLTFPPCGIYVLNKQPPNKQIWLSSPISGPKRYDWVVSIPSQQLKQDTELSKSGRGTGDWIYLRDGTTLNELLRRELGVTVDEDI